MSVDKIILQIVLMVNKKGVDSFQIWSLSMRSQTIRGRILEFGILLSSLIEIFDF